MDLASGLGQVDGSDLPRLIEFALDAEHERKVLPHALVVMTACHRVPQQLLGLVGLAIERVGQREIVGHRNGVGLRLERGKEIALCFAMLALPSRAACPAPIASSSR